VLNTINQPSTLSYLSHDFVAYIFLYTFPLYVKITLNNMFDDVMITLDSILKINNQIFVIVEIIYRIYTPYLFYFKC
jgi:hypothetical protein